MKRIVVFGNSIAGVKAVEEMKTLGPSCEATIFSFDGCYPNRGDLFADLIAQEIPSEEIFYKPKDFYKKNGINLILDKKVSRINIKKKKIFTEDKEQIDFDILLVTDSPEHKFPAVKGTHKDGVFGIKRLKNIYTILDWIPFTDTVAIQSDSFQGFKVATALAKRGKEVILFLSERSVLFSTFPDEVFQWITGVLEEKGVRIVMNNPIAEVLGDTEVKAVRLQSGKVMASQMVLFSDTREDLRVWEDSFPTDQKICVDAQFHTALENVFALDTVCQWQEWQDHILAQDILHLSLLEEQGKVVGKTLSYLLAHLEKEGADQETQKDETGVGDGHKVPLLSASLNFGDFSLVILGETRIMDGIREIQKFDRPSGVYKKFLIDQSQLRGAVLINAANEKDKFLRFIEEKISLLGEEDFIMDGNCESNTTESNTNFSCQK